MHSTAPLSRSASSRVFSWLAASRRTGKGETVEGTSTIDNRKKQVQALLLNPITVDEGLVDRS